ncbi:Smr/MutS family protein [Rhizorhapis sp. SPR117]|uniref:Smr/MutS family protein n=1 Tax=Rhizorhapis sp. SPR117 TaxID=2912611 RepID=UPI001F353D97|nr:Smr/MutS family protein [Rhizorhapis sp. SPR117]
MARRRLSPEERAAWNQLARSVKPLSVAPQPPENHGEAMESSASLLNEPASHPTESLTQSIALPRSVVRTRRPADILDGSWERQIKRGLLQPEITIDLHGHSLSQAHQRFDRALANALAHGVRVMLVITGKPRDGGTRRDRADRGVIRAEIGHWISNSQQFGMIASVRNAHPRHGGSGAIYVILRRNK